MIRTPRPSRRTIAALAAVSSAAALAVIGGPAHTAAAGSADAFDPAVCQGADTHFFLNNVSGTVQAKAYYSVPSASIYEPSPTTVRWTWHKLGKHVLVSAADGLIPLGGFKQVDTGDGLVQETNVRWRATVRLPIPSVGTGYWLCGDDPAR